MLFLDGRKVSAEELMMKFATRGDFEMLEKRPSFEISKSRKKIDHVNKGRIKTPVATSMRSHFLATDPIRKIKIEIRYAESHHPQKVGDRVLDTYEPRYITTKGATFAYQTNLELAAFMFLHPNNDLSPLQDKSRKQKGKYEYIDVKKRSKIKVDGINALTDALSHAKTLEEDRLVIFAKGLGIKGIDKKDLDDVRADVMEYAQKNPQRYNEKRNTEITFIEGRITNLIDKGIVKLNTVGSIRRWSWASGEREGEHILDIQNVTQDAKQSLKNFFFGDIQKWMNILNDITNNMSAREKLERDLKIMAMESQPVASNQAPERTIGSNLPDYLKEPEQPVYVQDEAPVIPKYTREDAIRILTEQDEYKTPPHHKTVEKWLKENA